MTGALQPLLASGSPIICLSLNPPLSKEQSSGIHKCETCHAEQCLCSIKAALTEAVKAALKTKLIKAVKVDTAYYEQFGPSGLEVSRRKQSFSSAREDRSPHH